MATKRSGTQRRPISTISQKERTRRIFKHPISNNHKFTMKKTIFHVKGMHCKSCETVLTEDFQEQEGVKKVAVSYAKGTVAVEYDEKKVSEEAMRGIIRKEGYEVA